MNREVIINISNYDYNIGLYYENELIEIKNTEFNEFYDYKFYIYKNNRKIYKIEKYDLETLNFINLFDNYKNDVIKELRKRKLKEICS